MSNAKALSVEIVSPVVSTSVGTGSVIITCASGEQQNYRRSCGNQKFIRRFHRSHLKVFLRSRPHGFSILKSARRSNSCFCCAESSL
jgi:hypothetical protein